MLKNLFLTGTLLVSMTSFCGAQSWQQTGSLSTSKRLVSFTTLDNNKVLVTGGINQDAVPHAECELFDPVTGTWSLTDSMHVARILSAVVRLHDGRVAVFGGQTMGTYDGGYPVQTDLVEIYDPNTAKWSENGHMKVARQHHTASLLPDGRVLIAGGLSGVDAQASAEIYDPMAMSSQMVAPMFQARYEQQAASLLDGRVMITGGRIGGWDGIFFDEAELYDPVQNTWTVLETMHQRRMRALLVQFSDGSILSAAGRNAPTTAAPGSELYNMTTSQWNSTDPMKLPTCWLGPVLLPGDRYLATGGITDGIGTSSTDVQTTATCEWYDKPNARWYYAPKMHGSRSEHGAAYLHQTVNKDLPTDMVIVGGGLSGPDTYTSTCEILDIGQDALRSYMAMPLNQTASVGTNATSNEFSITGNGTSSPSLHFSLVKNDEVHIQIISSSGVTVKSYDQGTLTSGSYNLTLQGLNISSGMYLATLRTSNGLQSVKLAILQ